MSQIFCFAAAQLSGFLLLRALIGRSSLKIDSINSEQKIFVVKVFSFVKTKKLVLSNYFFVDVCSNYLSNRKKNYVCLLSFTFGQDLRRLRNLLISGLVENNLRYRYRNRYRVFFGRTWTNRWLRYLRLPPSDSFAACIPSCCGFFGN